MLLQIPSNYGKHVPAQFIVITNYMIYFTCILLRCVLLILPIAVCSLMSLLQYTDLSARTTSMDNGGDATVERRPGSGAYDHFADS